MFLILCWTLLSLHELDQWETVTSFSTLLPQELMGRPVRLKFSVKTIDGNGDEKEREDISEGQPKEA